MIGTIRYSRSLGLIHLVSRNLFFNGIFFLMLIVLKTENGTCLNADRKDPIEKLKIKEKKDN